MTALETVYAVHNFEAENDDELSFQIGEKVFVIQKDDGFGDGWWKGENIRGQIGLFPMNYITFEQPHQQIIDLLTPSTSDSTNTTTSAKKPMHIDTNLLDNETSESPSVRSSYSFTCPISSSSTTGPSTSSTHSNSGGVALRRSIVNTLFLPSLRSTTPEDWDIDQVEIWLNAMNFGSIATNFKLQEITGDVLLELNMNSLKELDIPTFGKRFKLHTAINALREECGYQPTNRMSVTSSTYSTDSRFIQQKSPTSSSTSPSSARYSNPIYARHSASYHSNLVNLEKQHQRRRSHTSVTNEDQVSPQMLSPVSASNYDIMEANSQNYEKDQKLPVSPSKKDIALIQQVQQRQTVLPMAHRSSMEIYSTRTTDENGAVTPDMEGWLYKQGCKYKKWNKRWFVLKGPNLFYFKSPKDVRMKGIINLRGYKVIPDETIQPGKYSFKAQHEEERTFYFYTDLDTSMKSWISSLMKATISRDFTAPVLSSSMIPTVSLDVARRMRPRPPSVLLYRKDNNANLSPRSYEASYGYQTPISEKSSSIITADKELEGGESSVTTKEERLNQDSGFDSNDQEEEEEEGEEEKEEEEEEDEEDDDDEDEQQETFEPFNETYSLAYKDEDEGHLSSEECQEESLSWTPAEYIQWVNTISNSIKIKELHELRQGDVLIEILEELSGKTVKQLPPSTVGSVSMMMLDNIVAVFKFMSMEGIEIDNQFAIKDIFGGNEEKIMLMLQSILNWSIRLNEIRF
ncbi:hypothetical protein HMPREF1544_09927 [Mucor circinelloides 1006PhL]|uniref:Polar growth protein n=1 Tax=Mucor circinelloides f. circinelloides (strain 1006PhL) TaxID=1220926 RepID=S2J5A6_MUCC1|nr:hypothetical protein HMPREF1544_09927 [Mucor circinelloides 1006PhL]